MSTEKKSGKLGLNDRMSEGWNDGWKEVTQYATSHSMAGAGKMLQ